MIYSVIFSTLYHVYWLSSGQISHFPDFQTGDNFVISVKFRSRVELVLNGGFLASNAKYRPSMVLY